MGLKQSSFFSMAGGIVAFILSLSCCWLPALIVGLGGAASMMAFADSLESYSGILMTVGAVLLCFGGYRYYRRSEDATCCVEEAKACC